MGNRTSPAQDVRQREERRAPVHKIQLSERQQQSIRSDRADGIGVDVLARRFGVSEQRIREVCQAGKQ